MIEEERLKVLLQMAGATAHEINQPLTALLGTLEMMASDLDNPENVSQRLREVISAGNRIAKIVKNIQTIRRDHIAVSQDNRPHELSERRMVILSIEDNDEDFADLKSKIDAYPKIQLMRSATFKSARLMIEQNQIDLILLDYLLPDGDGLSFIAELQQADNPIPAIVITGQGDETTASQMIQAGAYDYIPKHSVSDASLNRAIANALEKARLKREMLAAQRKMAEMSTRDGLTRLFNRRYFIEALEREIDRSQRYGTDLTLAMFDLDHFKRVNDRFGHPMGDEVLQFFARTLEKSSRSSDLACRYGGEEFVLICPNSDENQVVAFYRRLQHTLAKTPFNPDQERFFVTASCGISCVRKGQNVSSEQLIMSADQALYDAKKQGRNRAVVCPPKIRAAHPHN